jgi:DNA-binding FadR family transcriptional regulator
MPSASILADRIEDHLWREQDCALPSTEAGLCESFAVGRRLVRQASRVLQQRGVMTPHRGGGGAGGLRRSVPGTAQVARLLADAVRDECDARALDDARSFLRPRLAGQAGPLSILLRGTIASLEVGPSATDASGEQCSRAGLLATDLSRELSARRSDCGRVFLGSLDALAERHATSLEIAVEAVRLLEDRQMVELRRGRGGGVYGSPGSIVQAARMANAFLAGNQVSIDACGEMLSAINVRMIDLACKRADAAGLDPVRAALAAMRNARSSTELGVAWYPLHRAIAILARSPVLHIMAQSLAGSLLLRRLRTADLPHAAACELLEASQLIAANVLGGEVAGNREAHWSCQRALKPHW